MFELLYEHLYIPLSFILAVVFCPLALMCIHKLLYELYSADNLSSPDKEIFMPQSRVEKWFSSRRLDVYQCWIAAALLSANAIRAVLILVNATAPLNLPTVVINTLSIISFCLITALIESHYEINESVKAITEALESKQHTGETQCSQSK